MRTAGRRTSFYRECFNHDESIRIFDILHGSNLTFLQCQKLYLVSITCIRDKQRCEKAFIKMVGLTDKWDNDKIITIYKKVYFRERHEIRRKYCSSIDIVSITGLRRVPDLRCGHNVQEKTSESIIDLSEGFYIYGDIRQSFGRYSVQAIRCDLKNIREYISENDLGFLNSAIDTNMLVFVEKFEQCYNLFLEYIARYDIYKDSRDVFLDELIKKMQEFAKDEYEANVASGCQQAKEYLDELEQSRMNQIITE